MMETTATVAAGADDGQYNDGMINVTGISGNLNQAGDRIGFRFTGIEEEPGRTLVGAYLRLFLPQAKLSTIRGVIRCAANEAGLVDLADLALTEASAPWAADNLGTGFVQSPSFAAAVEEVWSRPGWAGEIMAVIEATADAPFRASTIEKGAEFAAALLLQWEDEPMPEPEPEPPRPRRQVSVIVRDLEPGESHEIRLVRPRDIVLADGGIDWEATKFAAFMWLVEGE